MKTRRWTIDEENKLVEIVWDNESNSNKINWGHISNSLSEYGYSRSSEACRKKFSNLAKDCNCKDCNCVEGSSTSKVEDEGIINKLDSMSDGEFVYWLDNSDMTDTEAEIIISSCSMGEKLLEKTNKDDEKYPSNNALGIDDHKGIAWFFSMFNRLFGFIVRKVRK